MTFTLPTTPAECRAVRKQVLALLEGSHTRGKWRVRVSGIAAERKVIEAGIALTPILIAEMTTYNHLPAYHNAEQLANLNLAATAPETNQLLADLLEAHAQALEALEVQRDVTAGAMQRLEQRWVSVEDALPEVDVEVLFVADGAIAKGYRTEDGWEEDFNIFWANTDIKYWQPLPAPPAAEATAQAEEAQNG